MKLSVLTGMGLVTSSCGTFMHPERRGQPRGRLDWRVVALDGLCLIFFFIPGVVAFAVDISSGAIYLPPESHDHNFSKNQGPEPELKVIQTGHNSLSDSEIENQVLKETGVAVRLNDSELQKVPMGSVKDFWPTWRRRFSLTS